MPNIKEQETEELEGLRAEVEELRSALAEVEHQVAERANRRFLEMLQSVQLISLMLDTEGLVIYCNDFLLEVTGYERAEVVGRQWFDVFIPENQRDIIRDLYLKMLGQDSAPVHLEYEIRTKGGDLRTISWNNTVLKDQDGRIIGMASIGEDSTERKRAEEQLHHQLDFTTTITESLGEGVCALDETGLVTFTNTAARRMTGWSEDELLGQDFYKMVGMRPSNGSRGRGGLQAVARLSQAGATEWEVVEFRRRDDSVFLAACVSSPLVRGGRRVGSVITFRDVTERYRAEETLRETRERLTFHMENSPLAVIEWDADGRVTRWHKSAERLFGWRPEDVLGKSPLDWPLVVAEDRTKVAEAMARLRDGEERTNVSLLRNHTSDGQVLHSEWYNSALPNSEGRVISILSLILDTSKRRQAEAERDEERRLLDAVLDNLPVGVMFRDANGRLAHVNRTAAVIFGLPQDELQGMTTAKLVTLLKPYTADGVQLRERDLPPVIALRTNNTSELEFLYQSTGGEGRRLSMKAAPITFNRGKSSGSVVVFTDVTLQRHTEEHLRQAQRIESIGRLAGGIAHDFNNLLTIMSGNVSWVIKHIEESNPDHEKLVKVDRAVTRAKELTEQLLAFSRKAVSHRKILDLNVVVEETVSLLDRTFSKELNIETRMEPAIFPVKADPTQMSQILMNLCVNARDAMPEGGELTIETRNIVIDREYVKKYPYAIIPGKYVMLRVSDTGTGMDEATRQRAFEPFFTTKEQGKGTGLGLSTVYGLVKDHGGHVNIESALGADTTIEVFLPRAVETEGEKTEAQPNGGGEKQQGSQPIRFARTDRQETVLIVDDEPHVLDIGKLILKEAGYVVLTAISGAEALKIYRAQWNTNDIALLDMKMPKMNGRVLFNKMRAINPDVKAVLVSGHSSVQHAEEVMELGMCGYLQKPFTDEQLLRAVRSALDLEGIPK